LAPIRRRRSFTTRIYSLFTHVHPPVQAVYHAVAWIPKRYQCAMPDAIGDRGQARHAHLFQRRSVRTPDYSTGFAAPSTIGCAMIVEIRAAPHSDGRCLATIPSLSSAEAAQATTTARVNTGDRPRRVARVTMRRGPWRSTSASAMTRLTGGVRFSAGIEGRIDTMPFPDCIWRTKL
jgi:hypothetical protein